MLSFIHPKSVLVALAAFVIVSPDSALAVPTIRVWDGVNAPLLVADESGGDTNSGTPGMVTISGMTYHGWSLDLEFGLSKPFIGSATAPELSFYAAVMSSAAGALTIQFSDNGFGPVFGGYSLSYGGETAPDATAAYKAYVDNTNLLFGGSVLASSVHTGAFNQNNSGGLAAAGPFSLTHEVKFTHLGGTSSSMNAELRAVSVPDGGSTIALLGATFLALGAVRRKFQLQ